MALDTEFSASKTSEQILNAAEVLFAEKGFRATTLKDVTGVSGCNSALVSYYFGSKEGLRRAIFQRQSAKTEALINRIVTQNTAVNMEEIQDLVREIMAGIRADATYYRLNLWVLADGRDVADQDAAEMWNPTFKRFLEVIKGLNPGLDPAEHEARCLVLCGTIHHYANLRWNFLQKMKFESQPEELLARYEDFVCTQVVALLTRP